MSTLPEGELPGQRQYEDPPDWTAGVLADARRGVDGCGRQVSRAAAMLTASPDIAALLDSALTDLAGTHDALARLDHETEYHEDWLEAGLLTHPFWRRMMGNTLRALAELDDSELIRQVRDGAAIAASSAASDGRLW